MGLKDDYTHDGRVIVETIKAAVLPPALLANQATLLRLGQVYKQINAPFGQLGLNTLTISTHALEGDDSTYTRLENQIQSWTRRRDSLAEQMKAMLEGAEFNGQPIDENQANSLMSRAQALLAEVASVAGSL